jgi:hypothetical protein
MLSYHCDDDAVRVDTAGVVDVVGRESKESKGKGRKVFGKHLNCALAAAAISELSGRIWRYFDPDLRDTAFISGLNDEILFV